VPWRWPLLHIGAMNSPRWNPESRLFRDETNSLGGESHGSEGRGALGEAARGHGFGSLEELRPLLWAKPERCYRQVPGRLTFPWPEPGSPRVVVKRFVGDLRRDRWYEYLRGRRRSPGQREYENLVGLRAAGLPVPEALGWYACGQESLVVMAFVPHGETLRQHLDGASQADLRRWVERLAPLVARLHAQGWYHRDLYLEHLVLAGSEAQPELMLLDLGRARCERQPRARWLHKDLGALLHSAPAELGLRARLRGLVLYGRARGITDSDQLRLLAVRAEAFRRRIAAHLPRYQVP
jgi:tRNA A-37 threonylcarbamoyl transferase component Bud32